MALVTADAPPDPIRVALMVAQALDDVGIPYVIGGSVASSLHGVPRLTNDVDFVIRLGITQVTSLASRLGSDFYISEDAAQEAIENAAGSSFNVINIPLAVKVDLFPAADALDNERLAHRRPTNIGGSGAPTLVNIDTAEDVVLRKLDWYRKGGEISERQWRDVIGVLRAQSAKMDMGYVKKWSLVLGVGDLLDRAIELSSV
jgi:hypothetical protein